MALVLCWGGVQGSVQPWRWRGVWRGTRPLALQLLQLGCRCWALGLGPVQLCLAVSCCPASPILLWARGLTLRWGVSAAVCGLTAAVIPSHFVAITVLALGPGVPGLLVHALVPHEAVLQREGASASLALVGPLSCEAEEGVSLARPCQCPFVAVAHEQYDDCMSICIYVHMHTYP